MRENILSIKVDEKYVKRLVSDIIKGKPIEASKQLKSKTVEGKNPPQD